MKKIKNIIVGLDFSRHSNSVLEQARALAKQFDAQLVVAHVIEEYALRELQFASAFKQIQDEIYDRLQKQYHLKPHEEVKIVCGRAFEKIIEIARKQPQSMIVVGHRSHIGAMSQLFLGSTAERLAMNAKVPVWVHRNKQKLVPKKIMVPCDFSEKSERALEGLRDLNLKGASIELHHVQQPTIPLLDYSAWQIISEEMALENQKKLTELKKRVSPLRVRESISLDVAQEIVKQGRKYDLIAISPQVHKGVLSGFGRVTSKLVRSSQTSVLIIP